MTRRCSFTFVSLLACLFAVSMTWAQDQSGNKVVENANSTDQVEKKAPPRNLESKAKEGAKDVGKQGDKQDEKDGGKQGDAGEPQKDPTQPSDRLRDALLPTLPQTPGKGATRIEQPAPPRLPVIRLRARVLVKDRPGTAIIEVDQSLYRVQKDSLITVVGPNGAVLLRIDQLDAQGITVHVETLNQTILLK